MKALQQFMNRRFLNLICAQLFIVAGCGKDSVKIETRPVPVDADAIPGEPGPEGPKGPQGEPGAAGPGNAIVLYDATDEKIGYKFRYELGGPADVFRKDGSRAVLDMDTGELKAPLFDFFCLYQEADCDGACYVYDQRWLGVILYGADEQLFLAERGSEPVGAIDVLSYKHDDGSCQSISLGTVESFLATPYEDNGFVLPLAAPLYWGIME